MSFNSYTLIFIHGDIKIINVGQRKSLATKKTSRSIFVVIELFLYGTVVVGTWCYAFIKAHRTVRHKELRWKYFLM